LVGAATYKPPFVPIEFVIDTQGNVSVQLNASVSTPIGDFGVGAAAEKNVQPASNGMLMFIQRLIGGEPKDAGFQVHENAGVKKVVIDDTITLQFTGNLLSVDARGHHTILLTSPDASSDQSNARGSTSTHSYQSALTTPDGAWAPDQNCFFASDGFHITPNLACQSPVRGLSDVDVSVQMRQISGAPTDENGIEVRRIGDPASLYEFDIAATGAWLFKVCIRSFANCNILASGSDPAILTGLGAVNTIEVSAVGSHFVLLVNGTQVGQADDTTIASGDVWLDSDGTSECVFTNFAAKWP
jgi:hypothetical protein